MAPNGKNTSASARPASSRLWDPKEILQIIDERDWSERNPHLRIDVKAIRDRRKTYKPPTPSATPERASKRSRHDITKAICCLTIWEGSGPEVLVQDQVFCSITNQSDTISGERRAKVELEEPFMVSPQDLSPKGKRGITAIRYSMQITLQAASLSDRWPPVDLQSIPPPNIRSQKVGDGFEIYPIFAVSYPRLPHVPTTEDEASLPVTALQDYKQLTPRLGFHVDMRWVESATPLEHHKQLKKRKSKQQETTREEVPRSPSVEYPKNLEVETIWRVREDSISVETCVFAGYICPLCNNREFDSSDLYWFHLVQSHDLFKFRVTTKYPETNDDDAFVRVLVKLDLKDALESRRDANNNRFEKIQQKGSLFGPSEIEVLKTYKTFFDLEQYLRGDEDKHWGTKRDGRSGLLEPGRADSNFESARAMPLVVDLTRPAKAVPDLPPPRRGRYPVPEAPAGVTFFSLRVKRPLQKGELLSESDDDIDESWALQKHSDRIDSFKDLTAEERSFLKRHDRHMLRENVNSNLHYREALVRFCRLNREWLQRPEARLEFAKKLTALQLEGVIKIQQIFEYLNIVDAPARQAQGPQASQNSLDLEENVKSLELANAGVLYSFCADCKGPIRSATEIIRCSNPTCTNDYHKSCLNILPVVPDAVLARWRCPRCPAAPNSALHTEDAHHGDPMSIDRPANRSPELAILNKFAPDHLSRLPQGRRLGPGPSARYARHSPLGMSTHGDGHPQSQVQDSEADSDDHAVARQISPLGAIRYGES